MSRAWVRQAVINRLDVCVVCVCPYRQTLTNTRVWYMYTFSSLIIPSLKQSLPISTLFSSNYSATKARQFVYVRNSTGKHTRNSGVYLSFVFRVCQSVCVCVRFCERFRNQSSIHSSLVLGNRVRERQTKQPQKMLNYIRYAMSGCSAKINEPNRLSY